MTETRTRRGGAMQRRVCVWHVGKTYNGKGGGARLVVAASDDELSVKVTESPKGGRFMVGSVLVITPQAMVRWTDNTSKDVELVEVQK